MQPKILPHTLSKRYHGLRLCAAVCLLLSVTACSVQRQSCRVYPVTGGEAVPLTGGLTYALPRTQVQVLLTVSCVDYSTAPFHEYAAQYLHGPAQPAPQDTLRSPYRLQGATLRAVAVPDMQYLYYVEPRRNTLLIDARGLLQAVNAALLPDTLPPQAAALGITWHFLPVHQGEQEAYYTTQNSTYRRVDTLYTRYDTPGHPSLLVAKTDRLELRKQAEEAVAQLQAIEEKQQQLIFGEYEGNYTKESIQYLYEKLEQMKQPYITQFVGTQHTDSILCSIDPQEARDLIDSQSVVIAYFSPMQGLLPPTATALPADARAVTATLTADAVARRAIRKLARRQKSLTSSRKEKYMLRYRMPQETQVTISCPGYVETTLRLPVMQYGAEAALPAGAIQAQFDRVTGTLTTLTQHKP